VPVLQLFGHAPVHSQAAYALAYRGAALPLRDLREEVHPAGAHEATHVGECGGSAGAARAQCEACFGATLGWPGMGVMGGGHRVPWVPQKWGCALWRGRWNRESTSLDIIVVSAEGGRVVVPDLLHQGLHAEASWHIITYPPAGLLSTTWFHATALHLGGASLCLSVPPPDLCTQFRLST
jgi:hypothetical protein